MEFTIEIYRKDKRKKEGRRLIDRIEVDAACKADVEVLAEGKIAKDAKLCYEVHATYREVRNIMSGKIVKEHYLTPYYCSVGSETYWSS